MSHTAQIAADYQNRDALAAAVHSLGGTLLAHGKHELYSTSEMGIGIQLPKWQFPIVVRADQTLAFDHYNGAWGNVADLERLHEEYSWAITEIAAQRVGWQTERTADGVRVYHPSGATITVTGDKIDLQGFTGGQCLEAMRQLALPTEHVQAKPSMGECAATCREAV
jgi:hypothetical protein